LSSWEKDGFTTLSLVEGHLKDWKDKKNTGKRPGQYKTAFERTLDAARSGIEKYRNGEVTIYDV
jgi:hypothetical protein